MPEARRVNGTVVIAISSVFFAVMAVTARTLAGKVPAAQLSVIRFATGVAGVTLLFLAQRQRPNLARKGLLLLRGLFGGAAVLTYFVAIERLGAAPATVLNYSSPIFASLFARLFLGERPTGVSRIGLALATLGAALVTLSTGELDDPLHPGIGALAGIASAVFGGAAMTVIKKVRHDTDALTVFLAFGVLGTLMSLPVALPAWRPLETGVLLTALLVGVLAIGGQLLFTWGMGHTTAIAGSATTQLVPAIAWVLALGWLHEPVRPLGIIGAVLCVGGVLLGVVPFGLRATRAASPRAP